MKMTPEQKAFEEYGFEKGCLRRAIKIIRRQVWRFRRVRYGELNLSTRREIWHEYRLKFIVERIRVKRAVCRRTCGQCIHFSPNEWDVGKDGCLKRGWGVKTNRCAIGCQYWEPKKEGE